MHSIRCFSLDDLFSISVFSEYSIFSVIKIISTDKQQPENSNSSEVAIGGINVSIGQLLNVHGIRTIG